MSVRDGRINPELRESGIILRRLTEDKLFPGFVLQTLIEPNIEDGEPGYLITAAAQPGARHRVAFSGQTVYPDRCNETVLYREGAPFSIQPHEALAVLQTKPFYSQSEMDIPAVLIHSEAMLVARSVQHIVENRSE